MKSMSIQTFNYMVHKLALKPVFNFRDHICAVNSTSIHAEPSTVVYLSVLDIHADTIEAMSEAAAMLHKKYIITTGAEHLMVADDAKTYLRLKELKQQYGDGVQWLLLASFPGSMLCAGTEKRGVVLDISAHDTRNMTLTWTLLNTTPTHSRSFFPGSSGRQSQGQGTLYIGCLSYVS